MRNQFKTSIQLTRGDICDLLLATLAAQYASNDGGKKWIALHEKLSQQLKDLDKEIDQLEELDKYLFEN